MRITNDESIRASQVGALQRTAETARATETQPTRVGNGPAAHIELSDSAQTIAQAKAAVAAAPDTRDALVASLKAQIEAGTYSVSADDIASQMMRRALADMLS